MTYFHSKLLLAANGVANNRRPNTGMPHLQPTPKFMQPVINFQHNRRLQQFSLLHYFPTAMFNYFTKLKNSTKPA